MFLQCAALWGWCNTLEGRRSPPTPVCMSSPTPMFGSRHCNWRRVMLPPHLPESTKLILRSWAPGHGWLWNLWDLARWSLGDGVNAEILQVFILSVFRSACIEALQYSWCLNSVLCHWLRFNFYICLHRVHFEEKGSKECDPAGCTASHFNI